MTDDAANEATTTDAQKESGKTFTQDQLNDLLARQKGDLQRKFADYDDLKTKASEFDKLANANRSDVEKLTGERDTFRGRAETAEQRLMRFEVAAEKGLPPKWAGRLTGSSKEELEADADALLKEIGPPVGGFDGGPRGRATPPQDIDAAIRRAAGRG